jgi:hypothetical protein
MPARAIQAAAEAADRDKTSTDADRRVSALIEGVSQLVEGQRRFAEEFGLTYERVFRDGFESFKGRNVGDVLREWLRGEGGDAQDVERLLQDLADHQFALLTAVEIVTNDASARSRLLSVLRRDRPRSEYQGSAIPQLVTAYARTRESVTDTQAEQRSAP